LFEIAVVGSDEVQISVLAIHHHLGCSFVATTELAGFD
jgi:hypothetical protein